jgi:predicted DNA-binding transcriptional regulator YafY
MIEKYVGCVIEIIYQDKKGQLTKRQIQVHSVQGELVRAFCMTSGAPRMFSEKNILAAFPNNRRAV